MSEQSGQRRHIHVITPGDHFSPRTGSAVPTVVNGLCAAGDDRAVVVVAQGTYPDRYRSAEVVEYRPTTRPFGSGRRLDLLGGTVLLPRPNIGRAWRATLAGQESWPDAYVFGHNAPQLIRYVDTSHHRAVLYAHNELLRSYSKWEAARTLARAERIISVSDDLAERTAHQLPAALAARIRVVGNGVDADLFRPAAKRPESDVMRVLFLGRTIATKGPDVLLQALAQAKRSDIQAVIVGSGGFDPTAPLTEYERSLRQIADGITPAPQFVPFIPRSDVPDLYRSADVAVVPSRWPDPCPLTLGEAAASGLPVVASRIGGIPQWLGNAGVLVRPGDVAALAEVLVGLASDPAERSRLGQVAREHALAHDWRWTRSELEKALADG